MELVFLVSICDTSTLDFVLELEVLFVDTALLSEDVKDVGVAHLLLVLEVLDARLSDRNVDLDKVSLLTSLHCLSLSPLGQVTIVTLTRLHVLRPSVSQNLVVENLNVFVKTVSLLLKLLLLSFLLGKSELALLDGAIRHKVFTLEFGHDLVVRLFLSKKNGTRMVLGVHSALQTIKVQGMQSQ